MKYMGSKARIAKHILPIILKDRKPNQYYVEPFVGGGNIIDKVTGNRIGADANKYLIALYKGLKQGHDRPREISRGLYSEAKHQYKTGYGRFTDFEIGWIGFMASFNGKFYDGGYSGISSGRNYVDEQIRNTEKQWTNLIDVIFLHSNYDTLEIPPNSIIYCDPPYANTTKYATSNMFRHEQFFKWCRLMKQAGHTIFISEYTAPADFEWIWEMEVTNSLHSTKTTKPIERLFTLNH